MGGILARLVSFGALVLVRLAHWVGAEPLEEEALVWEAPPSVCPGPLEVRERLVRLLGDDVALVRAEARVSKQSARWQVDLRLRWQGHEDVRTLEADRCDTLANAAVLLVASAADPLGALPHVSSEPPQREQGAFVPPPPSNGVPVLDPGREAPEPAIVPAPVDDPPTPRPRDRGPTFGWWGLLDLGSLPRLGAGLSASVAWRWPRARLLAEGSYLPAQRVTSAAPHARQGHVQIGAARLGACARVWIRAVELPLCAGVEAGGTHATGFGVRADLEALDPWVATFAQGGVAIPLMENLALVGRLEAVVPLMYSQYVFGEERLYQARPVVVRGGVGLEFRWGPRKSGRPENPGGG